MFNSADLGSALHDVTWARMYAFDATRHKACHVASRDFRTNQYQSCVDCHLHCCRIAHTLVPVENITAFPVRLILKAFSVGSGQIATGAKWHLVAFSCVPELVHVDEAAAFGI